MSCTRTICGGAFDFLHSARDNLDPLLVQYGVRANGKYSKQTLFHISTLELKAKINKKEYNTKFKMKMRELKEKTTRDVILGTIARKSHKATMRKVSAGRYRFSQWEMTINNLLNVAKRHDRSHLNINKSLTRS